MISVCPTGLAPLRYFFANAWLTKITRGAPLRSSSVMSRPAISGVLNVVSQPGVIALKFTMRCRSGNGTPPETSMN